MRNVAKYVLIALLSSPVYAGLITHTDYTAGSVITSAGQNTNENTIYNEFNGNIDNTNIKAGGVTGTNIANNTITATNLASVLTSTFTVVNQLQKYKRPALVYISATSVDVENNTGTANETCVIFPDDKRCVTEDTSSANKYRRFIITSTATYTSGTEDSGMAGTYAANELITIYAVKSQIDATKFVLAGSTNSATQANFATLNTMFGTNGWVPLGVIPYGDHSGTTTSILVFSQVGNLTTLGNIVTCNTVSGRGIRMATTAGATSLTWSVGIGYSSTNVPANILNALLVQGQLAPTATASMQIYDNTSSGYNIMTQLGAGNIVGSFLYNSVQTGGSAVYMKESGGASDAMDILLYGWYDSSLTGVTSQL